MGENSGAVGKITAQPIGKMLKIDENGACTLRKITVFFKLLTPIVSHSFLNVPDHNNVCKLFWIL